MTESTDDQQGFADLREGRSRRITPEVLQQEQATWPYQVWAWLPQLGYGVDPAGDHYTAEEYIEAEPLRHKADHSLAAWAVRAREKLEQAREEDRPLYRTVNELLAVDPGSTATEGAEL